MAVAVLPAARPRYGGVLRLETSSSVNTLDPTAWPDNPADASAKERLASLAFDTLVRLDAARLPQPCLALSWQKDGPGRRWEFRLREGVRLHDGSLLDAAQTAAALRATARGWTVRNAGSSVFVESDAPIPDLLAELASASHAIAIPAGARLLGSGPFSIETWEPGRTATLKAHEACWAGRPFLDGVRVAMSRRPQDQAVDLELGRADLVGLLPQDARRLAQRGFRVTATRPLELVALVVEDRGAAVAASVGRALSLTVDRSAIGTMLLQRFAEPAGALLPQWLSGYAFSFPAPLDRVLGRSAAASIMPPRPLVLHFDSSDPIAQAVADRVVVDAREAGLTVRVGPLRPAGAPPDLRLLRIRLDTSSAASALFRLLSALRVDPGSLPSAVRADERAPERLREVEEAVVSRFLVVPLVHLSELAGASARIASANGPLLSANGAWNLADAWLAPERP